MSKKHRYPEERKPRDTSYSKTWTLIEKYGLATIEKIWQEKGMYRAAEQLDTSPDVIRYIARKQHWKRPAEKAPAILQGVKNGNLDPDQFTTLDFTNCNLNLEQDNNEDE